MNSETEEESVCNLDSNLDSSSITRDQSIDYQPNGYSGYFYWPTYFHHLNQQSMMNLPIQVGPLNLSENHLNLSHSFIQQSNFTPTSASSSNMKDLYRYNPSNLSKKGKNPRTDNNSLKFRPNCDEWNLKDNINKYVANGATSSQCSISGDLDGDSSQNDAGYDYHEPKKEMAFVKKETSTNFEMSKVMKRHTSRQIYPINQPQFLEKYPTNEYTVVDENQMDEIIAKELDLALSLSKKGRRNSRGHKEKTRPKSGKRSSKNRLISVTVERIKAAVFSCNSNPSSFQKNKISYHEANQESFPQPQPYNQYRDNNTFEQFKYPQIMFHPSPVVMRQTPNPPFVGRKPIRYCSCKSTDPRMDNDLPTFSESTANHSNTQLSSLTPVNHSVHSLLH